MQTMQGLTSLGRLSNFFRENHQGIAPYPPYSLTLTPPDFFLFGPVKRALEGVEFPSEEELLAAIYSVLSNLTGDTLTAVFAKWVGRLN
jgi:hypothetical protein